MITQFRLENFKGHRDTELALRQFTVLVGDNGSGKTSVLEALRLPGLLAEQATQPRTLMLEDLVREGTEHMRLSAVGVNDARPWTLSITIAGFATRPRLTLDGRDTLKNHHSVAADVDDLASYRENLVFGARPLGQVALYRFRADQVAAAAYSDSAGVAIAEDGAQTAVVLADLKLSDDDRFDRIERALQRIVPSVQRLRIGPAMLKHPSSPNPVRGSKLYFDFQGAKNVPGHHASHGTLVVLALLTVLYSPKRPDVVLLDDFDHSLHPRAQTELVQMIKELLALDDFRDTQIITTTHSPYVLDEVSPEDVIAFALREDGTVAAKPLSEHPDAPKVNGSLKAGELWTLDAERDWVR